MEHNEPVGRRNPLFQHRSPSQRRADRAFGERLRPEEIAILQRRTLVYDMRIMGYATSEVAATLGITTALADVDYTVERQARFKQFAQNTPGEHRFEMSEVAQRVISESLRGMTAAEKDSDKVGFGGNVIKATKLRSDILGATAKKVEAPPKDGPRDIKFTELPRDLRFALAAQFLDGGRARAIPLLSGGEPADTGGDPQGSVGSEPGGPAEDL